MLKALYWRVNLSIKKIKSKRLKKKLGKNVDRPSLSEIKTNKYREKKGLPPLKKK